MSDCPPAPKSPPTESPVQVKDEHVSSRSFPVSGALPLLTATAELLQVPFTEDDLRQAARDWGAAIAPLLERRTGPRAIDLEPELAPWSTWKAAPQVGQSAACAGTFVASGIDPGPLPASEADIAFAPITHLSRWIERRVLTASRLTRIYLDRLERFDPMLRCVVTLLPEHGLAQAERADAEIASGRYRGPLHGIPWGAKDLLDTAGIPTTYGAEPFRDRVPGKDAAVVRCLNEAGAVLVAKLSMGGLALNDLWFGGQTMNPWLPCEGSAGSSAGSGAAVAAGLVAFSIASETGGSIVNPSMRCGVVGLRPTFGRVPRTGAMTLSWSLDKLGPIARSVEDTMLILSIISGEDRGDPSSVSANLDFDASVSTRGLRVGYLPKWMEEPPAASIDCEVVRLVRELGMTPREVEWPDWPYRSLNLIELAEAAAAFEELTLDGRMDQLKAQFNDAWPNRFRQARFLSAVDFVQADRFRRKVAGLMADIFDRVDILLVPGLREEMKIVGNFVGSPSLTIPCGFVEITRTRSVWAPPNDHPMMLSAPARVPHGVSLIGRPFEEGVIARAGIAIERALNFAQHRPAGF
jgi:Asp-tRNA(Asn)/Glu-tRNA(Gln) amidotransferase A subunit family amidase